MKNQDLYEIFIEELGSIYNGEKQIVRGLPTLIELASQPELKEALSNNLKETKQQVQRLEQIFSILEERPEENPAEAIEALVRSIEDLRDNTKSAALDVKIIYTTQKIEHFEMATYGTLRSFANALNLDPNITTLLQETLNEEGSADKKLTKVAEGSFLSSGINQEAAETVLSTRRR